jgi:hypothetical protein
MVLPWLVGKREISKLKYDSKINQTYNDNISRISRKLHQFSAIFSMLDKKQKETKHFLIIDIKILGWKNIFKNWNGSCIQDGGKNDFTSSVSIFKLQRIFVFSMELHFSHQFKMVDLFKMVEICSKFSKSLTKANHFSEEIQNGR